MTQFSAPHGLATALQVHFLFRGSVARSASGCSDPSDGTVRLTLIAAAAHLHQEATVRAARTDLRLAGLCDPQP